ncbi:L-threonylcarbamoyladenylate synthase [Uliginosibacterium sp. sgz301328]|uniref:L-threonylcarbamoyladenylate synthase n=1 Tax=Uliginosibacterium sp. sgz301328 TaxID=3243764 RepID=UPI00359D79B7
MSQYFEVHPVNPQPRLIHQAAEVLRSGGLLAVPTDASYSLVGHIGDAKVLDRIRRIRGVDERHHFTLMCCDLKQIATYARVDNAQYRLLKATTPGPYTFILEGTKELPRRVLHPKRKTIGLRVPDHPVMSLLLEEMGEPIIASTVLLPGDEDPLTEASDIDARIGHDIDLVIDAGACGMDMTTVVDLTHGTPEIIREGKGPLEPFGL